MPERPKQKSQKVQSTQSEVSNTQITPIWSCELFKVLIFEVTKISKVSIFEAAKCARLPCLNPQNCSRCPYIKQKNTQSTLNRSHSPIKRLDQRFRRFKSNRSEGPKRHKHPVFLSLTTARTRRARSFQTKCDAKWGEQGDPGEFFRAVRKLFSQYFRNASRIKRRI